MLHINVIDEDFDTSLNVFPLVTGSGVEYDPTKTFKENFASISQLNRELSKKIGKIKKKIRRLHNVPKYAPPSDQQLLAFQIYKDAYMAYGKGDSSSRVPLKPTFPVARTNTNMSNYLHRQYMYEVYLRTELKRNTLYLGDLAGSSSSLLLPKYGAEVNGKMVQLKHRFNPHWGKVAVRSYSPTAHR